MRKSMIRIAAIALAVVMLSTCAVTSIFAAYSVSDTCTIKLVHSAFNVTVTATAGAESDVVILPDGSGTLATVTVTGTPSVNAQLGFNANPLTITGFEDNNCPVIFSIQVNEAAATTYKIGDTYGDGTIDTTAKLAEAVNAAIAALAKNYTASAAINDTIVISWTWNSAMNAAEVDNGTVELNLTATVSQSN